MKPADLLCPSPLPQGHKGYPPLRESLLNRLSDSFRIWLTGVGGVLLHGSPKVVVMNVPRNYDVQKILAILPLLSGAEEIRVVLSEEDDLEAAQKFYKDRRFSLVRCTLQDALRDGCDFLLLDAPEMDNEIWGAKTHPLEELPRILRPGAKMAARLPGPRAVNLFEFGRMLKGLELFEGKLPSEGDPLRDIRAWTDPTKDERWELHQMGWAYARGMLCHGTLHTKAQQRSLLETSGSVFLSSEEGMFQEWGYLGKRLPSPRGMPRPEKISTLHNLIDQAKGLCEEMVGADVPPESEWILHLLPPLG